MTTENRNTVYLITGGNKGIGVELAKGLLRRPNTTVIAAVRKHALFSMWNWKQNEDVSSINPSSSPIPLALDEDDADISSESLVERLSAKDASITHIDVVIANAGGSAGFKFIADTEPADLMHDFKVNAVGPMKLFKACWPLLDQDVANADGTQRRSARKFVLITSSVGSIGVMDEESFPSTAYGMSKVAANWFAKKLSVEYSEKGLLVGIIHPGWVQTAMGDGLADAIAPPQGVGPQPTTTASESAAGILERIEELSPLTSGKFLTWQSGKHLPW